MTLLFNVVVPVTPNVPPITTLFVLGNDKLENTIFPLPLAVNCRSVLLVVLCMLLVSMVMPGNVNGATVVILPDVNVPLIVVLPV